LVAVIAWIYYSALILYFGAEFTPVYARTMGSHSNQCWTFVWPRKANPQWRILSGARVFV
jgi:uncharacterized BrkB/YihY/UPF0761 family membrane protein